MVRRALVWVILLSVGCGSKSEPSVAEALEASDEKEAQRKAKEAAEHEAAKAQLKKDDVLEIPWTVDSMKAKLEMGLTLEYAVSGTDAKGKAVEDTYLAEVKATNPDGIGVIAYHGSAKGDAAKQLQTVDWGKLSPFFVVERPQSQVLRKETVTVPAGTFETVVVELKGFFGAHRTVWMVEEKPGVYAKVVDHPNASESEDDAGDQTEMTYELTKLETKS